MGRREVARFSVQSLADPSCTIADVEAFVVDSLPVNSSHIAKQVHVNQYDYMKDVKLIELPTNEVSLLIGTDLAPAFAHFDTRQNGPSSLIAINSAYGWAVMGPTGGPMPKSAWAALVSVDEGQRLNEQLQKFFQADFPDHPSAKVGRSYEDQQAEEIMNRTCKFIDGRYQVGLLLKKSDEETAAMIPSAAAEATARQRT